MRKKRSRKKIKTISSFLLFNNKNSKTDNLRFLGIALALFLIFFYVFQVTEMTKKSHLVQSYNGEARKILEENRRNEYDFLKDNSINRAEELVQDLNYVRIGEVHYINIPDRQVAAK